MTWVLDSVLMRWSSCHHCLFTAEHSALTHRGRFVNIYGLFCFNFLSQRDRQKVLWPLMLPIICTFKIFSMVRYLSFSGFFEALMGWCRKREDAPFCICAWVLNSSSSSPQVLLWVQQSHLVSIVPGSLESLHNRCLNSWHSGLSCMEFEARPSGKERERRPEQVTGTWSMTVTLTSCHVNQCDKIIHVSL